MAWKKTAWGSITFGSVFKDDKGIYILLFDSSVITLNTPYHEFKRVENYCTRGQLYIWVFDDKSIDTTSVLKLVQRMVTQ